MDINKKKIRKNERYKEKRKERWRDAKKRKKKATREIERGKNGGGGKNVRNRKWKKK